jgi:hypothetical protein
VSLVWTEGASLYDSPVWLLVLGHLRQVDLVSWVFVRTRKSVLIAVLLHASTNLFAVSPVIISDLRLPILAMIAKWLLVIIVGLILIRLQPKPTGAQKSER